MNKLVESLINSGVLKTPEIVNAFKKIDRINFVPKKFKNLAYTDKALPIGFGQTISQPYTVAFMLELLKPRKGDCVLDVGSGSMWQSALLSEILGDSGKVYSVEINPEIFEIGKMNISKYPELSKGVEPYCQNARDGLPEISKNIGGFDCIIAAAEIEDVPSGWREQLKKDGKLVYPKNGSIFLEIKKSDNYFEQTQFLGFAFVPFIG